MTRMAIEDRRAMFVWLPNFAMTLARLKEPPLAKPCEPFALLEKHGNIQRIAALDEPAMRAGLYLRQPLADALAIYPKLIATNAEPEACETALTALAVWAQRYSPSTAPAPPSGLWLDITGCAHLWDGEAGLCENLIGKLEARGIPARAAIAPSFGAAYALAHHAERYVITRRKGIRASPSPQPSPARGEGALLHTPRLKSEARACSTVPSPLAGEGQDEGDQLADLLAPLPVERLRVTGDTASFLKKLGLYTIGDVQKLPRASLAQRCPGLLPQLDKALGRTQEAVDFIRPPVPWIERLRFAEPISAPEDLERVTAKLLDMLCTRMQAERQGGLTFEVSFFRSDGGVQAQAVSTALPVRDPSRIMRLFREKLGFIDPGFGIDLAAVTALRTEPLDEEQRSILHSGKSAACVEELAALIDALENRLGKGRIYCFAPVESYIPERAVKRVLPLAASSWSSLTQRSTAKNASEDPGYRQAGSGMTPKSKRQPLRRPGNANGVIRDLKGGKPGAWLSLGERPIRLFTPPQPIDVTAALPDAPPLFFRWRRVVHRIARAEGPERISPEWWFSGVSNEEAATRDYYRVESISGLRFWVFREGSYGSGQMPRWFLHGLFP